MNDFFRDFERMFYETPENRAAKKERLKRLFSRVFLALFVYILISQFLSTLVYTVAAIVMSPEKYAEFFDNYVVAIIVSSVCQYLIAFPVLYLIMKGAPKAKPRAKEKLSVKDFILLVVTAEAIMFVGNLIGTFLNNVFGAIMGKVPENDIANIVNEIPMYLIFILMVVIGPIVEELIFRKLMIDRLSIYGDRMAIIFTAIAFGLIHANLYQFFYATLLGILLGYVYTRTGKIKHTILLHMIVNFMGSIIVLPVQDAANEFYRLLELANAGEPFDFAALCLNGMITMIYTNFQYGMVIGGLFTLFYFIKTKQIRISGEKEIYLNNGDIVSGGIKNVGAILFMSVSALLILLNLFVS